jgi:hypothetical protein
MPFTFILSDENVNDYGYRVLTSGIDTTDFEKNPVMLYNHHRTVDSWDGADNDAMLPIGKWANIRKDGGKLLADAEFDEDDEFAMKIKGKVEKGILSTASIYFRIVERSEDPMLMLPGQTRETVVKSRIKEGSITDIPGNPSCHRLSFRNQSLALNGSGDEQGLDSILPLIKQNQNSDMDKKLVCQTLGMDEGSTDLQLLAKLTELKNSTDRLASENQRLAAENETLKKEQTDGRVAQLVDGAITAGKLTAAQKDAWLKLAASDYDGTKAALDGMQGFSRINQQLSHEKDEAQELTDAEEYRKLDREGKLAQLQKTDDAKFQRLYDAHIAALSAKGKIKRG